MIVVLVLTTLVVYVIFRECVIEIKDVKATRSWRRAGQIEKRNKNIEKLEKENQDFESWLERLKDETRY